MLYRSICRNSFFMNLEMEENELLQFIEYWTNPYLRKT